MADTYSLVISLKQQISRQSPGMIFSAVSQNGQLFSVRKSTYFSLQNNLFARFLPNLFSPYIQELQEWLLFRWQVEWISLGELGSPRCYRHRHMGFHGPVLPETLQTVSGEAETHDAKEQVSSWTFRISRKRTFCSPPPLKTKLILSSPCLFCCIRYF